MNYKLFSVEDFVLNESFQSFVYKTDDKSVSFWLNWIQENPDKRKLVDEASYLLRSILAEKHQLSTAELKNESEKLKSFIKENKPKGKRILMPSAVKYNWKLLTGIAASILLVLSIGLFQWINIKTNEVNYIVKETEKGQKLLIQLADGTTINLNSESSIKYPANFDGTTREVYLTGEGFFKVAKNEKMPFIVHSDNITTTVLGTSFNISSYDDTNKITVAVVTGRVLVEDAEKNEILLTPGLMVTYNSKKGFEKSTFKFNDVIGWKDGILSFNEATLAQVFTNLERWYGVTITTDKTIDLEGRYMGSFQNEPLANILDAFSIVENYEYKITGKNVSITKK